MKRASNFKIAAIIFLFVLLGCINKDFNTTAFADTEVQLAPYDYTIYVDGTMLENASYIKDGILYTKLSDIAKVLDFDFSVSEGSVFSFPWRKSTVKILAGQNALEYQGNAAILEAETISINGNSDLFVPAESFFDAIEVGVYDDTEESTIYFTPGAGHWLIPKGYNVPVLMYHGIGHADMISNLIMPPDHLEQQLQYLIENGYTTIGFEDLWHVEDFNRPIILVFDDGMECLYRYLMPLLEKYDCKATVAIIQNLTSVTQASYLSPERVVEMQDSGRVSFQSHTYSHRMLETLDKETQMWEMDESQKFITRLTKKEPFVLVYPSGSQNDTTLEIINDYYNFGVKMHHKPEDKCYNTSEDPRLVYRYFMQSFTPITQFSGWLEDALTVNEDNIEPYNDTNSPDASSDEMTCCEGNINSLYFGTYNGEPVKWSVLNNAQRNDGEKGMYLLSTYVLEEFGTVYHPSVAGWNGSSAQQWCSSFYDSSFTEIEKSAIPAVSLTEESEKLFGLTWKETSIDSERVFFLSAPELYKYFGEEFSPGISAKLPDGMTTSYYWLRTSHNYHPDYAGLVLQGGEVHDCWVGSRHGTRPAMNLDIGNILMFSPAFTNAPSGEVKATVIDSNRPFKASITEKSNQVLTVSYSNAEIGDNEYICAAILDDSGKCTSIIKLSGVSSTEGTVEIPQAVINTADSIAVANIRFSGDRCTDVSSPLIKLV